MKVLRGVLQIGAAALGIDIGTSGIKVAEVRRTARGIELRHFGIVPTPTGAVEAGVILDRAAVAGALGALLRQARIRAGRAVLSVTGQNVLARVLRLPPIPEDEVKQAIRWEAERHLPFPVDEAVIDAQTVREVSEHDQRQIEVLLAAAPEGLVLAHIETLESARIYVEAVEVGALAMARALDHETGRGTHALVNLGASTTDVAVVRDGVPQFTRTILIGGDQISQALARHMGMDLAAAEEAKIRYGMGWEEGPPGAGAQGTYASEVAGALEELVGQLRRSLDFYRAQFSGASVDGLVLCGGGARLRHIQQHFTGELELPVTVGTAFTEVRLAGGLDQTTVSEIAPQLVVATGLALRIVA